MEALRRLFRRSHAEWEIDVPDSTPRRAVVRFRGRKLRGIQRLKVDLASGEKNRIVFIVCPASLNVRLGDADGDIQPHGVPLELALEGEE